MFSTAMAMWSIPLIMVYLTVVRSLYRPNRRASVAQISPTVAERLTASRIGGKEVCAPRRGSFELGERRRDAVRVSLFLPPREIGGLIALVLGIDREHVDLGLPSSV